MDLKDKVAVVAGGSGAIGSASAHRLAQAGAKIIVGYNSRPDRADAVAASLPGAGHRAIRIPMLEPPLIREAACAMLGGVTSSWVLLPRHGMGSYRP